MGFTSLAALSSGVCFVLTSGVGSFTTHHCHFHITASSLEHLLLWVLCHPGEIFSLFDWCDYDMGSWLILSIIGHHLMHLKSLLSVKHILIPCIGTAISLVSATIISFLDFFFFLAVPSTYGSSQARGWIEVAGANLCHSQRNTVSKPYLQPML